MSLKDDLYKEVILDHFENPRNYGVLTNPNRSEKGMNPLCGDELELNLIMKDGVIEDIKFSGKGCSISQASSSMMTESVKGLHKDEARKIMNKFKTAILEDKEQEFTEDEADLEV